MKNEALKKLMVIDKPFLAELYLRNSMIIRKKLQSALNKQLRLVIHILHKIFNGEISMSRDSCDELQRQKKFKKLHKLFSSNASYQKILKNNRFEQIQLLCQFSSCYKYLFFYIFNEIEKKN